MDDPGGAAAVGVITISIWVDSLPEMLPPCSLSSSALAASPSEAMTIVTMERRRLGEGGLIFTGMRAALLTPRAQIVTRRYQPLGTSKLPGLALLLRR